MRQEQTTNFNTVVNLYTPLNLTQIHHKLQTVLKKVAQNTMLYFHCFATCFDKGLLIV